VREAVNDADVLKAVSAASAEPVANSPAEFAELVRKEDKKLGALAQQYPIE
jgi:tripartite-type tricarboxylate transporter receptor subunit TctC